jgi:SLOG cluster3 family
MIFLSASIPYSERDKKYFDTADVTAIRDAIRALATVVIPKTTLVWGGHPAITPLIYYIMRIMNYDIKEHLVLYQSNYFKDKFPPENEFFEKRVIVKENNDLETSLRDMRDEMIIKNKFQAGIFIGGMKGVEEEFDLFRKSHPQAKLLPVASTGAAARIIYDTMIDRIDSRLLTDYAYMNLFTNLLTDILE